MKISLITGANKGIGLETARSIGGTVLVGARDEQRGRAAEAALRADGVDARFVRLDVTDPATVEAAAAWIDAEHGHLDVLVNNAGILIDTAGEPPSGLPIDTLRRTFEVNVYGVVSVTNAMLPLLRRAPAARIVNVSSGIGSIELNSTGDLFSGSALTAYAASKSALNALTVKYAVELTGTPIKVNAVTPGFCATDINDHQGHRTASQGASVVVGAALLGEDGPTGTFFGSDGPVPW